MIDDNKTNGYYVVNWYGTPHKFQKDTDGFQAGDVVFNTTYINSIQQYIHCYVVIYCKLIPG